MAIKRYLADPALYGSVQVIAIIDGQRPAVRLAETPFHVQGGGQKADRGTIGGVDVTDVRQSSDGGIDHLVTDTSGLEVGRTYSFAVDPEWRNLNANYHSAGHLLAAVCESRFPGIFAAAGHQFPGEARVDFCVEAAQPSTVDDLMGASNAIEAAVCAEIAKALPIAIVGDPFVDRSCQVGDFPVIACGGTHAISTADIGKFSIRSIKRKGPLIRVGYELI
ncbi:Ser-tRNA(Ala) deacylase AlaX [Novosphingobium sp. PhB55]|uniref:alanyl-tRNA editing protein n=1 Tax=Novosphingobium sp. PhB55 TaxID=2485106 RepID=UPI0010666C89|nr:alanyl-tRNA editing protein [Novosphingobium sp. PhB55]TDW59966.1 Ser-tRNA(Ala) deacylase AlaX [Novosphingobium sp. PhB55]